MTNEGGAGMWVDCHATNGLVLWVLHGQECQRCGRLDAPLPTPEITLCSGERKKHTHHSGRGRITSLASKHWAALSRKTSQLQFEEEAEEEWVVDTSSGWWEIPPTSGFIKCFPSKSHKPGLKLLYPPFLLSLFICRYEVSVDTCGESVNSWMHMRPSLQTVSSY